eukprot:scaffold1739_cov109-Cylindrotheca_fusiformis.AAC.12
MESIQRHEALTILGIGKGYKEISDRNMEGDEWRRYGKTRRSKLLNEDKESGGAKFNINPVVRLNKYYQVITRSLDQFHSMWKKKGDHDLEYIYVLGHRILSFLTVYLPSHPDFSKPRSWNLRNKCRREVKTLKLCLEDIAVLIDELYCNQCLDSVPDFENSLFHFQQNQDSVYKSDKFHVENWTAFSECRGAENPLKKDSPHTTPSTIGSESDTSSSDGSEANAELNEISDSTDNTNDDDEEEEGGKILLSLDFSESVEEDEYLYQVANEYVPFEVDSDASDSWAQGDPGRSSSFFSYGNGNSLTCDPAEIAFRHRAGDKSPVYSLHLTSPVFISKPAAEAEEQSGSNQVHFDLGAKKHADLIASVYEELLTASEDDDGAPRIPDDAKSITTDSLTRKEVTFHEFNLGLLENDEWISFDGDEESFAKPFGR